MDFEQILIRLGVDAKAVTIGLTQVKSFVKGWATNLVQELKHHAMGTIGASAAIFGMERMFDALKEKAMFIKRLSNETGASTNMVQGMTQELEGVGEGFESLSKPLGRFTALIGQAKDGIPAARQKLIEWGIASKSENWNTLTLARGLENLSAQYHKVGGAERGAALAQAVIGRNFQALIPILEMGSKAIADMDKANFFTKLNPHSIEMLASLGRASKSAWNSTLAIGGNLLGMSGLEFITRHLESLGRGHHQIRSIKDVYDKLQYVLLGTKTEEMKHNETLEKKKELLEENLHIQQMTNEQHKLENELSDRNKLTVGEMADRAREIMGDKSPRGLKSIYAVTPAMMSALRIQSLEDRAKAAIARGNGGQADSLQSEADRIRLSNSALRSTEQDPMKAVRDHLDLINETLARSGIVVKEMPKGH